MSVLVRRAEPTDADLVPGSETSGRFHEGMDFDEVGRVVCYRKDR